MGANEKLLPSDICLQRTFEELQHLLLSDLLKMQGDTISAHHNSLDVLYCYKPKIKFMEMAATIT